MIPQFKRRTSGVRVFVSIDSFHMSDMYVCIEHTELKWEFFPQMHCLLCKCPNVVPPAVMTGVGPQGASTLYYQALPSAALTTSSTQHPVVSDTSIDPQLHDLDVNVIAQP